MILLLLLFLDPGTSFIYLSKSVWCLERLQWGLGNHYYYFIIIIIIIFCYFIIILLLLLLLLFDPCRNKIILF